MKRRIIKLAAIIVIMLTSAAAGAGIALAAAQTTAPYHVYVKYHTKFGPLLFGAKCPFKPALSASGHTATYGEGKRTHTCTKTG